MLRQSLIDYGKPLQTTEAPTPTPQGTEVLLRVSHCGVCHSDIHLQDGYFDLGGGQKLDVRGNRPLPFTFGHEIAGTVEAIGPRGAGREARASAMPPIPGSAAASAGCARGATSTCAMPRARSASRSTAAMPRTCWCRIRAICSTSKGIAPEIAGPLMCSGLTGYGAIKKAIPYLRAGPLLIVGLGGVGMMGLQFARALTDQADLRGRHRRRQARGSAEARRQGGVRSGRCRRAQGHRQGLRRRRGRGRRFCRLRQVAGLCAKPRWPRAVQPSSSA